MLQRRRRKKTKINSRRVNRVINTGLIQKKKYYPTISRKIMFRNLPPKISFNKAYKFRNVKDVFTRGKIWNDNRSPTKTITHHADKSGPEWVNSTGEKLYDGPDKLEWPPELEHVFVISMRQHSWDGMQCRFGKWANKLIKINATDGRKIDRESWIEKGLLHPQTPLTLGEIGCHDSHVRLWKHMIKNKIPAALILEDDADIRYTKNTERCFKKLFENIKRNKIEYDILFLGRHKEHTKYYSIIPSIVKPRDTQGLFSYVLTLQGAKKLLCRSYPYTLAVDVLVERMGDINELISIATYPRFNFVVSVQSSTSHIR